MLVPGFVRIQESDFDVAELERELISDNHGVGAFAHFTGYVRSENDALDVSSMQLEHYPGMTEKSISKIVEAAEERWPLLAVGVIHRVGVLEPGQKIVYVGVASAHRGSAFAACEYIMDYLKTEAPFWKKEQGRDGGRWVDARESDTEAVDRWKA